MTEKTKPIINLYGCGGCGVNLVSGFNNIKNKNEDGFADINPIFIDTSLSNILDYKRDNKSYYIFEGLDGAGKKRNEHYDTIKERSLELINKFKPSDLNIIIHSASGGSGSVIGPVLINELINKNATTIGILVGSSDSKIETHNSINTLKSYESISRRLNHPIICSYQENTKDNQRIKVDIRVKTIISLLCLFFSGENKELDTSDLRNFLNYSKVTDYEPRLCLLDFFNGNINIENDQNVISAITLRDENSDYDLEHDIEYHAVGYINPSIGKDWVQSNIKLPIHGTIINNGFNKIITRLTNKLEAMQENRRAIVSKFIVSDEESNDSGLIF